MDVLAEAAEPIDIQFTRDTNAVVSYDSDSVTSIRPYERFRFRT